MKKMEIKQAKAQERERVVGEIRQAFLKRGKENGDKTILWTAKEIVEVMDLIQKLNKER